MMRLPVNSFNPLKKRNALFVSINILALLLTACGGDDKKTASSSSSSVVSSKSSSVSSSASSVSSSSVASSVASSTKSFLTLDGKQPTVIAHRGASGYFPEHTLEAYTLAIAMGADAIEPDLVLTKDGVLVSRHDITLSSSTDIATHSEFAGRKRAGENGDGEAVKEDWFVEDFTVAELKTLRARSPNHDEAKQYNDQFKIATFQDILDLRATKSKQTGREITIYPETKNPSYHLALTKSGKLPVRMEDALLTAINAANLNSKDAPIFVQSFEPGSLQYLRKAGSKTKQVQLLDAYDVDFFAGSIVYGTDAANLVYSQPTDWKLAGDKRLFDWFLTAEGLAFIKTYADGVGPWKPMLVPVKCAKVTANQCVGSDGTPKTFKGYSDSISQPATTLVADAHKAGLFVHEYTFRNEQSGYYNLTQDMLGDPTNEYLLHYRLGVDGVFSDQADTAVKARSLYLKELGK